MRFHLNNTRFIFFFLFTLYYNTAFSCILFPFASFIQHIVVNNVKKKHKPEDNMVNIFRKIIRVQKNMRCIYLHEVQALKSATLLLFFFFCSFCELTHIFELILRILFMRQDILKRNRYIFGNGYI